MTFRMSQSNNDFQISESKKYCQKLSRFPIVFMEKGNTNLGGGMEYILFLNMTEDKDNFLT